MSPVEGTRAPGDAAGPAGEQNVLPRRAEVPIKGILLINFFKHQKNSWTVLDGKHKISECR